MLANVISPIGDHFPGGLGALLSAIFDEVREQDGLRAYEVLLKVRVDHTRSLCTI